MGEDQTGSGLSRRSFLQMVGMAGGATAVYETMVALGLINTPGVWAGPPRLEAGMGEGKKVVILGTGIGALTAAFELLRAGYTCEVLEAQDRAGGRSLTARHGTEIVEESPEHGRTRQVCQFGDDAFGQLLYLNMGPGRLPYHHRRVLHYCKLLKVALEVYVMDTTANLFQTPEAFGGDPVVRRRVQYDTQGYISELLAKAIRLGELDSDLGEEDEERLLELLKRFGDLSDKFRYKGSTRAGCRFPLTVLQACEPECPLPLQALLNSEYWEHRFFQPDDFEWQPTLFQPVNGMDKIVDGFLHALKGYEDQGRLTLRFGSPVTKINLLEDGVEIEYRTTGDGSGAMASGDYCVSNIPLPVLQKIPANFSQDFRWAVDAGVFDPTCKVGWQANERFWEDDESQIYGGISFIDHLITQMWYPSNGYFTGNGTLTGTYNFDQHAIDMGKMSLAERLVVARDGAIRLHKEFASTEIVPQDLGLSIAWQNIPFQRGGWARWTESDTEAYARLLAPDRNFYVVGDQVSTLPGWQEGAMMSAEHVTEQIAGIRVRTVPEIKRAPDTRRLVQGLF